MLRIEWRKDEPRLRLERVSSSILEVFRIAQESDTRCKRLDFVKMRVLMAWCPAWQA